MNIFSILTSALLDKYGYSIDRSSGKIFLNIPIGEFHNNPGDCNIDIKSVSDIINDINLTEYLDNEKLAMVYNKLTKDILNYGLGN